MPILGHPVARSNRNRTEAMDDALETSIERLRDHLRRPHARKRNHLTENAAYTVNQTDPQRAHTGNGAQVLATLRNTAINLHRLNGADNIAEACRITALTANRRLDLLNPQFSSSQAC
ncbi:transposase for IS2404 domain protein [Mycobacterium ulcerans str. Harvey]|uniref:Transposase for IS2404 domain protein n=1 Tax=Mycobacterium ulcerans str. Harvey TaxID=1299332 RepID=A0ABP3ARJ4_MYCUL|nr:transposase for IS2404 domain protein [Mycobacterium ulcerans str. Harvey]